MRLGTVMGQYAPVSRYLAGITGEYKVRPVKIKDEALAKLGLQPDQNIWYVWSDNEDNYSCLPYRSYPESEYGAHLSDLRTFKYEDVVCHPDVSERIYRAHGARSGMMEVPVPSIDYTHIQTACSAGLMEMIGNGVAMITPAGRAMVAEMGW